MKSERQAAILEILRTNDIFTQEELSAILAMQGFSVAQATVSRDIREMGLIKEPTRKGLKYVAPTKSPLTRIFRESVTSVNYAGNIMVLRTLNGMAMAVAVALDDMKLSDILGTVAGDDTVICVVQSKAAAASLTERLK